MSLHRLHPPLAQLPLPVDFKQSIQTGIQTCGVKYLPQCCHTREQGETGWLVTCAGPWTLVWFYCWYHWCTVSPVTFDQLIPLTRRFTLRLDNFHHCISQLRVLSFIFSKSYSLGAPFALFLQAILSLSSRHLNFISPVYMWSPVIPTIILVYFGASLACAFVYFVFAIQLRRQIQHAIRCISGVILCVLHDTTFLFLEAAVIRTHSGAHC